MFRVKKHFYRWLIIFLVSVVCNFFLYLNNLQCAQVIKIDGSTTVFPVAQKLAEKFMKDYPDCKIYVNGSGSGTGIMALLNGTTHIVSSSRLLNKKELLTAKQKGIEIIRYKIAIDGIIPIVHPKMRSIKNITMKQLSQVYSGNLRFWNKLGGPKRPITVISRDTNSGTYATWIKLVLEKNRIFTNALRVVSNGQVVQMVSQNVFAIGYVGIGFLDSTVAAVNVNGIQANNDTIRNGTWPITRSLFMYTDGKPASRIKDFIDFTLSPEGQSLISRAGFVSAK